MHYVIELTYLIRPVFRGELPSDFYKLVLRAASAHIWKWEHYNPSTDENCIFYKLSSLRKIRDLYPKYTNYYKLQTYLNFIDQFSPESVNFLGNVE